MKKNADCKLLEHPRILAMPLLLAAQAQAIEFNFGAIEANLDSQLSMGSSWRVEGASSSLLTDSSGGDLFSTNDDSDRNYQKGDAFSQIFKGSHDLQFSFQNFGGFVRGKYWYDSALENNSVDYGHGPTTEVGGLSGSQLSYQSNSKLDDSNFNDLSQASGAALLDAFVYAEFDVFDMPLDVRLGKQVVSWGESTFILGGINAINPIDVNAFSRPGAEIKEGLLPVNMAFANLGLSDSLSAEIFYQLEFQETVLPGCGTYFSNNDFAADGCDLIAVSNGDLSVARHEDGKRKARDDGQYGLAFRYLSEELGDTEFGFYAMNIHSRAPFFNGINYSYTPEQETQLYVTGANLAYETAGLSTSQGEVPTALQAGIDAGDADSIALQAAAMEYGNNYVISARALDASYYSAYPEDMKITGLSFATNVGSVALSGEISHTLDAPVQINGSMIIQVLLEGEDASPSTAIQNLNLAPGETVQGYRLFDISQLQMTAIKIIDRVAGASSISFIGEAGYTFIHGFDEGSDALKFGRSDIFGTPGDEGNKDDGFVTTSSWGYRARVVADYPDALMGINLQPMLAWSEDVKGYSPESASNFNEGQQSLELSVQATYLETYNASLSYTQFMGGDYSIMKDRDFASVSMGMQF